MIKDLRVTKGTVVRTVMTLVVIINIILKICGIEVISVDEENISSVIENLVSISVIAIGFWKNNSFSLAARNADFALAKLKNFDSDEADDVFDEGE